MKYNLEKASGKLSISNQSLKKHIKTFYREFCKESERIEKILTENDFDKIYFEFHKLKSTFKMISADNIVSLCQDACDTAIDNKENQYEIFLEDISEQFKDIILTIDE